MIHKIKTITYPYTLTKTCVYMINTRFEHFVLKHKKRMNIFY